jgi:hypothetical protein
MSDTYRHHCAHAGETRIVLVPVEVPVAGPQFGRQPKPPAYPSNRREAWKPAQGIPVRSKRAATVELLRRICQQEAEARAFMRSAREQASHAG